MRPAIGLASDADVAAITDLYRPIVESTAISFETEPPDQDEMHRRIAETLTSYPWLVCRIGGKCAGYAYASDIAFRGAYRWSVDTSVYVHEDFRRHGIGRGLYISLFGILSAQGYFNAFAGISLPNPASVALHERVGFQPLGIYRNVGYKLGSWHDVGWWQLSLRKARDRAAGATRTFCYSETKQLGSAPGTRITCDPRQGGVSYSHTLSKSQRGEPMRTPMIGMSILVLIAAVRATIGVSPAASCSGSSRFTHS